jgi:hypothetical protein
VSAGAIGQLTDIVYRQSRSDHASSSVEGGEAVVAAPGGGGGGGDARPLPWRLQPAQAGGGLIMDVGCHALDGGCTGRARTRVCVFIPRLTPSSWRCAVRGWRPWGWEKMGT